LFFFCLLAYLLVLLADLKIPDDEGVEDAPIKGQETGPENGQEGLDNLWNKRMKERLEKMKSKKMRDMSITVTQKVGVSGTLASRQRKTSSNNESSTVGQGRIREELDQQQGKIKFLTGEEDGTVEICVQSILASNKNPTRFAMKVTWAAADMEESDRNTQQKDGKSLDSSEITSQMGRLERDIQTLQNRVKACLNNADFNKDQEATFHQQSISMNKAARYWPMIHLTVILLTGFTQANHIVQYFKTHHIGV
jgi:emp24/gp25L/p24 family/GOLD